MTERKKAGHSVSEVVFELDRAAAASSPVAAERPYIAPAAAGSPDVELSPVFMELASVELPEIKGENHARLQMQSPTRLFFYWSVKNNPYQRLKRIAGGGADNYRFVVRLVNLSRSTGSFQPAEAAGSAWFDVDPSSEYRAEVGFYSSNRPYVRVMYSNTVATPRKSPSPRAATDADWTVTSDHFARVLDASGFQRDAFDVAVAGEDNAAAEAAAHRAFATFAGGPADLTGVEAEDLRYALLAIAAGITLEDLRWRIGASLFAILQANSSTWDRAKAASAMKAEFGIDADDAVEEEFLPAVHGSSLVNFPRRFKKSIREMPKLRPVSSFGRGDL